MRAPTLTPTRIEYSAPLPSRVVTRLRGLTPAISLGLGIYALLIFAGAQLLNDPDTQWHLAVGRWILANGSVPTTDLFSHTFYGAPWIAKEWASQLIFAGADGLAGWRGVVAVSAAAIAIAFALLFGWLRHRLRATVALALTLVAVLLCAPHLLARPHALALPVMVLWTIGLVAGRERDGAPSLWLAPLMCVWTNLHGSFPIGLVLAAILAGEGVIYGRRGTWVGRLRAWAVFLMAAAAATMISPYGWQALLVPLQMAGNQEVLPFIAEWQPLTFDLAGTLAVAVLGVGLWSLAGTPRSNIFRIAAVLLLAVMMVRHSRFIDQFALLAPILFASALARRRGFAPQPTEEPTSLLLGVTGALALGAFVLTAAAVPAPTAAVAPGAALQAARASRLSGPVYNDYDFGGFLIANGIPTFVDGRTDQLFLHGFLPAIDRARRAEGEEKFAALLAKYRVRWALVRPRSADVRHLSRLPGWREVYKDADAAVYAAAAAPGP